MIRGIHSSQLWSNWSQTGPKLTMGTKLDHLGDQFDQPNWHQTCWSSWALTQPWLSNCHCFVCISNSMPSHTSCRAYSFGLSHNCTVHTFSLLPLPTWDPINALLWMTLPLVLTPSCPLPKPNILAKPLPRQMLTPLLTLSLLLEKAGGNPKFPNMTLNTDKPDITLSHKSEYMTHSNHITINEP